MVGFPTSVRVQFFFAANSDSMENGRSPCFYIALLVILLLLLFVSALIYAKQLAKALILPLRKLCAMVKKIANGEYKMGSEHSLSGEFLLPYNDIHKLSSELAHEKNLRETLEKDKKQMLLDISHDLRNPLATILGCAEALSADPHMMKKNGIVIYR